MHPIYGVDPQGSKQGLDNVVKRVRVLITTTTLHFYMCTVVLRGVCPSWQCIMSGWIVSTELSNQACWALWLNQLGLACHLPAWSVCIKHVLPAFEILVSFPLLNSRFAQCFQIWLKLQSKIGDLWSGYKVDGIYGLKLVWCIYWRYVLLWGAAVTAAGHTHPGFVCMSAGDTVGFSGHKKVPLCLGVF